MLLQKNATFLAQRPSQVCSRRTYRHDILHGCDLGCCRVDVALTVDDGLDSGATATTVEVLDTWAPVIVCPDDIVQAPAGPSGNTVSYAPTATDACDANPVVESNPPSGSLFAVGTTTVVTVTATDSAGNSSQCTFTVRILSVDEMLADMAEDARALGLNRGLTNQLLVNLENIRRWYTDGKVKQACDGLHKLIKDVNKDIRTGKTDAESGQTLIDSANNLRAIFGC